MGSLTVSVVVATRDRRDRLFALLHSLDRQDVGRDAFEVVVVDDASDRPLAQAEVAEVLPELPMRMLYHDFSKGPAAARNTGWIAARAPFIAFTDDDCEATPGWLRSLLDAAAGHQDVMVQGTTRPHPAETHRMGPFSRTQSISGPDGLFETCNLGCTRTLLARVHGFDERFRHPCGEDVDLGLRATKAGGRLFYAADALVFHAVHRPGAYRTIRGLSIWTDAVRVLKLHPERRPMLPYRVFWKRSHPPVLLALAALLLAGRRRRVYPLALFAPWVEHHRRAYARAGWTSVALVRMLPAHFAVDTAEVVTMLRGSIEHRTLML